MERAINNANDIENKCIVVKYSNKLAKAIQHSTQGTLYNYLYKMIEDKVTDVVKINIVCIKEGKSSNNENYVGYIFYLDENEKIIQEERSSQPTVLFKDMLIYFKLTHTPFSFLTV